MQVNQAFDIVEFDVASWRREEHQQRQQREQQEQQEEQQEELNKESRIGLICKSIFSILLSQIGTFSLVLAYVALGGLLFEYLERGNEISSCSETYSKFLLKLDETVDIVYIVAQGGSAEISKTAIKEKLIEFAQNLFRLQVDPELNCTTLGIADDNIPDWNFANAMYFCVTIITTIGYGHIAPATMWGKIVCMVYSILGIPTMLLFLTKIGEPTAMLFKSFYLNIFCCKCFVKNRLDDIDYDNQQRQEITDRWTVDNGDGGGKTEVKQPPLKMSEFFVLEECESEDCEEEIVNIPIIITIMLLILYIFIGVGVFKIWEDWTAVEAAYFSFITLSTIGFGDLVPGKDGPFNSPTVITELLIGAVYCIFGLTVLSMCINLIQDEISAKLHWIGLKLGLASPTIIDEDDEEDEEDDDTDSDDDADSKDESGLEPEVYKKQHRHAIEA